MIISIEGNIGSGKSTFFNYCRAQMYDRTDIIFVEEPVDVWESIKDSNGISLLQQFYNHPYEYAFCFQMTAYISRLVRLKDAIKRAEEIGATAIITERCVYTDYNVFTKMLHTGKSEKGEQILKEQTLKLISTNLLESKFFPIEIATIGVVKDENYINGLEAYGWGLGCRTLLDPSKQNNLGSIGEFGWGGAASTYFLVDNKKNLSATIMTQVLFGNPDLTRDFYKYIYSNL